MDPALEPLYDEAIRDTIERFEATGSPVITDGEQRKYHNFWTYSVHGMPNTAPDGFRIPFSAGHTRRMLRLTGGPFRYQRYADAYLDVALRYAHVPSNGGHLASALTHDRPTGSRLPAEHSSTSCCGTRDRCPTLLAKGASTPSNRFTERGWRQIDRRECFSTASST